LYWHQVTTGWTLGVVVGAMVFLKRPKTRRSICYARCPPLWSYIAIYQLDHFLWAAPPAVVSERATA
jgi:hypothetical protein